MALVNKRHSGKNTQVIHLIVFSVSIWATEKT